MATLRSVIVDTGGSGNYTSLNAALAGEAGNIVTSDEYVVITCKATTGAADTTAATVSGWTVDSSHYVEIRADDAHKATAAWNSAKYTLSVSGASYALNISGIHYTRITGLQIQNTRSGHFQHGIYADAEFVRIVGCFIRLTGNYAGAGIDVRPYSNAGNLVCTAVNNVLYSPATYNHDANAAIRSVTHINTTNYPAVFLNNTMYGFFRGIYTGDINTKVRAINNLIANTAGNSFSCAAFHADSNYNATDDSSSTGGANDRTNQTFSFVDASNLDFRLTSSDTGAKDHGTDLSSDPYFPFSVDINGTTRPQGSAWDIGAFEFQSAGGAFKPFWGHANILVRDF